jgi:hypothetical protein
MQVSAHKDAVSPFERYAKGGENPKLKDWAGKALPTLQHHFEMAQALTKAADEKQQEDRMGVWFSALGSARKPRGRPARLMSLSDAPNRRSLR